MSGIHGLAATPVFGLSLTLGGYLVGRWVFERTGRHPLAQPVLIAIVLIMAVLGACHVSYADYMQGAGIIGFWLGPATVALALPLYHEFALVRRAAVPVLVGVAIGSLVSIGSAILFTSLAGGGDTLQRTLAPKAATTPIAIALTDAIGGLSSITAVCTIVAGITGAVLGPWLLSLIGVRDARARGIALGSVSHGIGTSRALHESRTEGAFSGLAMALNALATSVWIPILFH
jgi:predicted murein hydrolase (TIGR00659 family)